MPKRLFDIALVVVSLPLALPLTIGVGIAILVIDGHPVLYWSQRVGRDNRMFPMPKFRTMRRDTPTVATHLLKNARGTLTRTGGFLRASSLDELPQLFSVLRGHMSIVGPRPALFNQDDLIGLRTRYGIDRLSPGITGWAQVNGRDELSIPTKVAFEREYLERRSFALDLRIIWLTVRNVISRRGVHH